MVSVFIEIIMPFLYLFNIYAFVYIRTHKCFSEYIIHDFWDMGDSQFYIGYIWVILVIYMEPNAWNAILIK